MESEPSQEAVPAAPNAPGTAASTRAQHVLRVLPRDWGSLATMLTPAMERIDPTQAATQVLVVTADAPATYAVVRGAFAKFGIVGVDLFPATAEGRSARIMAGVPVPAIAGPPSVLHALLTRSVLKLSNVRAVVFAWIEDLVEQDPEALKQLEAVLAEVPRDAAKSMVVRRRTPKIDAFVESHMFRARQVGAPDPEEAEVQLAIEYVVAPRASRPAALWRALDELDPPSAVIVARDPSSEADARTTLAHLGYRRANDAVRLSTGEIPANTHTVIFYDTPLSRAELQTVAATTPARIVVFAEPGDVESLKALTAGPARPLQLSSAVKQARRHEDVMRGEIKQLLDGGVAFHELRSLEPLLDNYDGIEIAAVLLRLLEQERAKATTVVAAPAGPRPAAPRPAAPRPAARESRDADRPPKREFRGRGDRGKPARGGAARGRPSGGRPERTGERPRRPRDDRR